MRSIHSNWNSPSRGSQLVQVDSPTRTTRDAGALHQLDVLVEPLVGHVLVVVRDAVEHRVGVHGLAPRGAAAGAGTAGCAAKALAARSRAKSEAINRFTVTSASDPSLPPHGSSRAGAEATGWPRNSSARRSNDSPTSVVRKSVVPPRDSRCSSSGWRRR